MDVGEPSPFPRRGRNAYLVILGITLGVVLLILAVAACERFGLITSSDSPAHRALDGEPVTVELRAGVDQVVYSDSSTTSDVKCAVTGHTEVPVTFRRVLNPFTLSTADGNWYAAQWVHVESDGPYEIQCTGTTGGYGVGTDGRFTRFLDEPMLLFGAPGIAVACGIAAGLVVWQLRRRRVDSYPS